MDSGTLLLAAVLVLACGLPMFFMMRGMGGMQGHSGRGIRGDGGRSLEERMAILRARQEEIQREIEALERRLAEPG